MTETFKKGSISFLLLILLFSTAFAQQPALHSLYMFDQLLINPAYAGTHVQLSATGIHRNQWVNFPGSPITNTITVQSGFARDMIGVGLTLYHDVIGIHTDKSVYMSYAYKLKLPNGGTFQMGLSGGIQNLVSDYNKITRKDLNDPGFADVNIAWNPNFGTGVFYTDKSFYAGASVPFLLSTDDIISSPTTLSAAKRKRIYYFTAGNTWKIAPEFKFMPSLLVRFQENNALSFDLNAHFVYLDAIGLGASYRVIEGTVLMFELKLNENLHVGYAYDVTTSYIRQFSGGSHEIMVNYRYRIPAIHKGMECPSYF